MIFDTHLYHFQADGEHWTLEQAGGGFDDENGRLVMLEKKRAEVFGETTAVVTTTGPPKSTFLEVFYVK